MWRGAVGFAGCGPGVIAAGEAVRYRPPETGAMVAQARIDLSRFRITVARTALCEPESLSEIDIRLAREIGSRDHMSTQRFTSLVDTIVARVDADALRRRKARARAGRNVRIRPDRFTPGAARLSAQLDQVDGARMDARLSAMAAAVHPSDPRTTAQRRADALLALAQGDDRLVCACPACAAPIHTPADDTPADADAGCPCSCAEHRHSSSGTRAFVSGVARVGRAGIGWGGPTGRVNGCRRLSGPGRSVVPGRGVIPRRGPPISITRSPSITPIPRGVGRPATGISSRCVGFTVDFHKNPLVRHASRPRRQAQRT